MERRWIDTAECARLIRKALAATFPGTKFRVRTARYAGGSAVDVRWTDGPTQDAVERVAERFRGATFDGSDDSMHYHESDLDGERVRYAADFVPCQRDFSYPFMVRVAGDVQARTGVAVTIKEGKYGPEIVDGWQIPAGRWESPRDLLWRALSVTAGAR